ncbi:transposase [Streptomyces galilaeus]
MEDRVRTNKAMGLGNLPSQSCEVNRGWMLTANLAADLDAWLRLPALHDIGDLADDEPDTMRFRLYHPPARLTDHACRRWLRIKRTWPWAKAFITCWHWLPTLPARSRRLAHQYPSRNHAEQKGRTGRSAMHRDC